MTNTFHSGVGRAGDAPASGEREAREREEDPAVWVLAVAEAVARRAAPATPERRDSPRASGESATGARQPRADGAPASRTASASSAGAPPVPERLITELSDTRLGRLELNVARGAEGLSIVINVADAHVKTLIEADHGALIKSLQDCGLRVARLQIGQGSAAGTALARETAEGVRSRESLERHGARRRAYQSSPNDADEEDGVDFLA